ncbi:hypothetical protein [Sphingomonas sp. 37zxx]|uniref:hypothetical protein n=1 Tax=Sphingomonas sp. 37zxx TaxID=1550073 RepID=UPI0018CF45A9|nr:hypothetical protein [Sphingomonas sp. 37zxx]
MGEERIKTGRRYPLQVAKLRADEWSEERKQAFLEELADSCNVARSARLLGMSRRGLYRLRWRDPSFAAAWSEAIRMAYPRLEERLLEQALAAAERLTIEGPVSGDGEDAAQEPPLQPLSAEETKLAMYLLDRLDRLERPGAGKKSARGSAGKAHGTTRDETNAVLNAKLDMLAKRMKAVE